MRNLLILSILLCVTCQSVSAKAHTTRQVQSFDGEVSGGKTYRHRFNRFVFLLEPYPSGYRVTIADPSKPSESEDYDLSWLTTPMHGLTDRDIEAKDFRNSAGNGKNDGTVNRPQMHRVIYFSKDGGKLLRQFNSQHDTKHAFDALAGQKDGVCDLWIKDLQLSKTEPGQEPLIAKMTFNVKLKYRP